MADGFRTSSLGGLADCRVARATMAMGSGSWWEDCLCDATYRRIDQGQVADEIVASCKQSYHLLMYSSCWAKVTPSVKHLMNDSMSPAAGADANSDDVVVSTGYGRRHSVQRSAEP
jgi:hypothetical protein